MKMLSHRKCEPARSARRCRLESLEDRRLLAIVGNNIAVGDQLQNYRIAIAATAEYTDFFGGVSQAYQAIGDFVDELNQIFEPELAIHLDLVSGNNVVYTNPATDPFTNGDPIALLGENQTVLDAVVGSSNYDVGHVFGTFPSGGSGIASLGVVGRNDAKARGSSSLFAPVGASFLGLVGHEIAHQFGAEHTFNGVVGNCGPNRSADNAYEPGSGTTLQSYAGICGSDNIQSNEDAYFHAASFEQIHTYIDSFSYSAPHSLTPTSNSIPTVDGGADHTIPARSFFELTAAGADADSDPTLTYTWEQLNLGPAQALDSPDNGSSPLFRSDPPDADPARSFPRYNHILTGTTPLGEILPTTTRNLNFRVTVRDSLGGVNSDDVQLNVIDTGSAFRLTSPNTNVNWVGGSTQTITWDVAGTDANGIDTSNVEIRLSTDGGQSFPQLLATTPNDGSEAITLPNIDAAEARLRIEGSGNVFFDVSDSNFSISADDNLPPPADSATVVGREVFYNDSAFDNGNAAVNANDDNAIATDKQALLPGHQATFANYTSNVQGITGLMIDVIGAANAADVDLTDFTFHTGRSNTPATWTAAPAPTSLTVREGAGSNGSDRIVITWKAGEITDTWLEVTATAGGNLALASDDVFYFGNAIGDTGDNTGNAQVDGTDFSGVRGNPRNFLQPVEVDNVFDLNRDARVNATDLVVVRDHATLTSTALPLITPPATLNLARPTSADASLQVAVAAEHDAAIEELAAEDKAVESELPQFSTREIDYRALLYAMREHRDRFTDFIQRHYIEAPDSPSLLADALGEEGSFWQ